MTTKEFYDKLTELFDALSSTPQTYRERMETIGVVHYCLAMYVNGIGPMEHDATHRNQVQPSRDGTSRATSQRKD